MARINSELTFEERIRNQKIKRKKTLILKLSIIFSIFALLAIYFLAPISRVSNSCIEGTKYYSKSQILRIAGLNERESLYTISDVEIKSKLDKSPLLGGDVNVVVTPFGMKITVDEKYPIFHSKVNDKYYFDDGSEISDELLSSNDVDVGEFLKENIRQVVDIDFIPDSTNITKKMYKTIVSILSSLSSEDRDLIDYLGYEKTTNSLLVYYDSKVLEGKIKFVCCLNSSFYEDALHHVLNQEYISERESYVTKKSMQAIIEDGVNVYAWNVVIEENSNKYIFKFIDIKETQNG